MEQVHLPLSVMDDAGKAAARTAIATLHARGTTNLSGGIISALSQVGGSASDTQRPAAVLVLTDGHPTCGSKLQSKCQYILNFRLKMQR